MFIDPDTQLIIARQQHLGRLEQAARHRLAAGLQTRRSRRRRRWRARGLDPTPDDIALPPAWTASDSAAFAAVSERVDESSTLVGV